MSHANETKAEYLTLKANQDQQELLLFSQTSIHSAGSPQNNLVSNPDLEHKSNTQRNSKMKLNQSGELRRNIIKEASFSIHSFNVSESRTDNASH